MSKLNIKFGLFIAVVLLVTAVSVTASTAAPTAQTDTQTTITFPDLTGPYKVGRTGFEWVDESRDETYASIPGLKRDLMITIWFPADPAKRAKIAPYMGSSNTWDIVTRHPELESMMQPRAYTTTSVAAAQPSYPVLIFEPDTSITSFSYTSIIEELASQGYIVVGMSHPYNTAAISYPDGRMVTQDLHGSALPTSMDDFAVRTTLTQDIHFVLDRVQMLNDSGPNFKGHFDMTRIGIIGHFYGGLIALLSATDDPRIKAGASLEMDPATQMTPPNKPFLYVGLGAAPRTNLQLQDTYWMYSNAITGGNYGDFPWLESQIAFPVDESTLGAIDPTRGVQITNSYLVAFFNHYLNGVDLSWPSYDETKLVTFPVSN